MPTITILNDMASDRPAIQAVSTSTSTANANTMTSSANDVDRTPTAQTTADTTTMTDATLSMTSVSTNPSLSEKPDAEHTPPIPSTYPSVPSTNMYPSTIDNTKMPDPPTMITTMDRFPSTSTYGNTDLSTNEVKPPTYPTYMGSSAMPGDSPHYHNNYYHEIYPVYTYPMVYDTTYSSYLPGDAGYAPNMPTANYPTTDYFATTPSMSPYGGNSHTGPSYMGNGWSNADNRHKPNIGRYPDYSGHGPEGKYNGTRAPIPYIRTYFNPDDYYAKREYT